MSLDAEVRGPLAEAGFTVVDELDLGPWRGSNAEAREESTVRWTVADEAGRRGFVVLTRDAPREGARSGGATSLVVDYLSLAVGVFEGVGESSLVDLRVVPVEAVRFRRLLEAGVTPRPFVPSVEVASLYERLGGARLDLARAAAEAGGSGWLVSAFHHPESAEPREHERVREVLDLLDDGVPVEWALRRVSPVPR